MAEESGNTYQTEWEITRIQNLSRLIVPSVDACDPVVVDEVMSSRVESISLLLSPAALQERLRRSKENEIERKMAAILALNEDEIGYGTTSFMNTGYTTSIREILPTIKEIVREMNCFVDADWSKVSEATNQYMEMIQERIGRNSETRLTGVEWCENMVKHPEVLRVAMLASACFYSYMLRPEHSSRILRHTELWQTGPGWCPEILHQTDRGLQQERLGPSWDPMSPRYLGRSSDFTAWFVPIQSLHLEGDPLDYCRC